MLGWVLASALIAWPLAAEVVVVRLPDGTRQVRNSAVRNSSLAGRPAAAPAGAVARVAAPADPSAQLALRRLVVATAEREGVDPRLAEAVVRAESAWNPSALSAKGAIGLMQLMPATAAELAVGDPWDAAENIDGGVRYMRHLLDRFDRLEHAIAAYNAGPGAVERHGGVPPYAETRDYVRRVLAYYDGREPDFAAATKGPPPRVVRTADGRWVLTNAPGEPPTVTARATSGGPARMAGAISVTLAAR